MVIYDSYTACPFAAKCAIQCSCKPPFIFVHESILGDIRLWVTYDSTSGVSSSYTKAYSVIYDSGHTQHVLSPRNAPSSAPASGIHWERGCKAGPSLYRILRGKHRCFTWPTAGCFIFVCLSTLGDILRWVGPRKEHLLAPLAPGSAGRIRRMNKWYRGTSLIRNSPPP